MADWIAFDGSYVLGAMPTDVRTAYDAWLAAHTDKAGRLAEIAGQVRADFRAALSANPNVTMDPDETQLQTRCVPHVGASGQLAVGAVGSGEDQWAVGREQLAVRGSGQWGRPVGSGQGAVGTRSRRSES